MDHGKPGEHTLAGHDLSCLLTTRTPNNQGALALDGDSLEHALFAAANTVTE